MLDKQLHNLDIVDSITDQQCIVELIMLQHNLDSLNHKVDSLYTAVSNKQLHNLDMLDLIVD